MFKLIVLAFNPRNETNNFPIRRIIELIEIFVRSIKSIEFHPSTHEPLPPPRPESSPIFPDHNNGHDLRPTIIFKRHARYHLAARFQSRTTFCDPEQKEERNRSFFRRLIPLSTSQPPHLTTTYTSPSPPPRFPRGLRNDLSNIFDRPFPDVYPCIFIYVTRLHRVIHHILHISPPSFHHTPRFHVMQWNFSFRLLSSKIDRINCYLLSKEDRWISEISIHILQLISQIIIAQHVIRFSFYILGIDRWKTIECVCVYRELIQVFRDTEGEDYYDILHSRGRNYYGRE